MRAAIFSEDLERRRQIMLRFGRLDAVLPLEQDDVARPRQVLMVDRLDQPAVAAGDRDRCHCRPVGTQGDDPGELGGDGRPGMIALAMNPERIAPVARIDAIGGVIRYVCEPRRGTGGQRIMPERRLGEP